MNIGLTLFIAIFRSKTPSFKAGIQNGKPLGQSKNR